MGMEYNVNRFVTRLLEENEKYNLVSRKNPAWEIGKHIEDSMRVLDFIDLTGQQGADIGAGAGFPGLIMAIGQPQVQMALIESNQKKGAFLRQVILELGLLNAQVIEKRAEEAGRDIHYRGGFDFCTSRAVTSISVLLEYGIPLVKIGGKLLLWKGRNYKEELAEAKTALELLKAKVTNVFHYTLKNELDRTIVEIEKLQETPDKFPRRVGIPAKRPL